YLERSSTVDNLKNCPQSLAVGGNGNAPVQVVAAPNRRLNHSNDYNEEVSTMSLPTHTPRSAKDYALQFLQDAADDYTEAIDRREYYAVAAKRLGVSNQQIEDIYNLTDGAVRAMLKRAGDK